MIHFISQQNFRCFIFAVLFLHSEKFSVPRLGTGRLKNEISQVVVEKKNKTKNKPY
jgi:hypothetical protein